MVDSNWSNWSDVTDGRSGSGASIIQRLSFLLLWYSSVSHLSRSDLDVEVVPLVGDLEDLWPREPVDPEPVSVDQQATTAHSQHDGHTLRVLHTTQLSLIFMDFLLFLLAKMDVCLAGLCSGRDPTVSVATDQHDKHAEVDIIPHQSLWVR